MASMQLGCVIVLFLSFEALGQTVNQQGQQISATLQEALARYSTSVRIIELSGKGITIIPANSFVNYRYLQQLYLHVNSITSIEDGVFNGLPQLTNLALGRNEISYIQPRTFNTLRALKSLHLNDNSLTRIEAALFQALVELSELYLGNNQIDFIEPNSFQGLNKLGHLDLSNNKLHTLQPNLFSATNLRQFDLNGNQMNSIDSAAFYNMKIIGTLSLHNNSLREVQNGLFAGQDMMEKLNLANNQIRTIEEGSFEDLSNLKILQLGHNNIWSSNLQSGTFRGLTSLSDLELNGNYIFSLDSNVLVDLPRPLTLDITENSLQCNQDLCWLQREMIEGTIHTWRFRAYQPTLDLTPNCMYGPGWVFAMKDCVPCTQTSQEDTSTGSNSNQYPSPYYGR